MAGSLRHGLPAAKRKTKNLRPAGGGAILAVLDCLPFVFKAGDF